MKETKMEHYRSEIEEKKYYFGKRKDCSDGKDHIISCVAVNCPRCDFYIDTGNNMNNDLFNCGARKINWLMSPYKPEPVLTEREKHFVEFVQEGWLARDENGDLEWHKEKPFKYEGFEWRNDDGYLHLHLHFCTNNIFRFITWEDEEPWSVEDLRKLKVEGGATDENSSM